MTRSAPVVCVAAVWQMDDALVLVRSVTGPGIAHWRLPGGAVHPGESLAEAVVRTTGNDTGAEGLCGPFLGWIEGVDDDVHTLTMCFEAVVLDPLVPDATGAMPTGTAGAPAEVRLTPTWEVTEVRLGPGLAEFLADHDLIELVI